MSLQDALSAVAAEKHVATKKKGAKGKQPIPQASKGAKKLPPWLAKKGA